MCPTTSVSASVLVRFLLFSVGVNTGVFIEFLIFLGQLFFIGLLNSPKLG